MSTCLELGKRGGNEDRKKAENYFKKRWPSKKEFAEDFGSFCTIQWLEGKREKTNLYRMAIDYLRTFSSSGDAHGSFDILSQRTTKSIESTEVRKRGLGANSSAITRFEAASLLRDGRLNERERIILILYFEWGFTKKEISHVIGVVESRINKIFDEILEAQKKRILSDEIA